MVFQEFGSIDQILLLPEKSFSIVAFTEASSASVAYDKLNGSIKLTQHGQPLYLTYAPSCMYHSFYFSFIFDDFSDAYYICSAVY